MTETFEYELEFIGPEDVLCTVCVEITDRYHDGTDDYGAHTINEGWRVVGYYDEDGGRLPKKPSWLDMATIESELFERHS
jgi:hypothetical protein